MPAAGAPGWPSTTAASRHFVYTAVGREWEKEGVLVRKGDAHIADIRCAGAYKSEIGPALFEQSDIPAGADEFDVP